MIKSKLLYLEEKEFVSTAYYCDKKEEVYSIKSEINKLANKHLFSIIEYRRLVKKVTSLKNKIPVYFSDSLLLFYIKDSNNYYWINFFNILKICYERNLFIIFKNGDVLEVSVSKKIFDNELVKISKVLSYINSLYK